jgi:dipeptidyl aminopeptidase/acylaminoacyl peptidase
LQANREQNNMPDERVLAAINNWAPRFTSQGVDYNDFVHTTSSLERWDDWLDAWCSTAEMHVSLATEAEAEGRSLSAGEAWVRAALCYHFAKFVWMLDMAKYRTASDKAIECLYQAHKHLDPTAERVEIPFDGVSLAGNLRRPAGVDLPPLVLLLPGLDSTKEEFFYWEDVFLKRGLATFSLDGPGQGETGYTTSIRSDYDTAVNAVLDGLETRGDLDLKRVGAVGVSLGGYYAPRAAAFEPRIKAVVPIGGPYNFGECWDQLPSLTRETYQHHSGAKDPAGAKAHAYTLDLGPALSRIKQPMLIVFGKLDRLIPYQHAERVAAEAPNARLVMYENGNHVCNNLPYKYRPLVADWIRETLLDVG